MENVYMSLTGNDNNDGTENNPVKSLSKSMDLCNVNGNIYIYDGDYIIDSTTEYKFYYNTKKLFHMDKSVNIIAKNYGKVGFTSYNIYATFGINTTNIYIKFIGIDFSNCPNSSMVLFIWPNDDTMMGFSLYNCKIYSNFYNYGGIMYFYNCYIGYAEFRRPMNIYLNNTIINYADSLPYGSVPDENLNNCILDTTFEQSQNIYDKGVFSGQYNWKGLHINSINYNIINS